MKNEDLGISRGPIHQENLVPGLAETRTEIQNENCRFSIDSHGISGRDLKDRNNEPSCYNETKRGLNKAWQALLEAFNDLTTMNSGSDILEANGIRMHYYCAMD